MALKVSFCFSYYACDKIYTKSLFRPFLNIQLMTLGTLPDEITTSVVASSSQFPPHLYELSPSSLTV